MTSLYLVKHLTIMLTIFEKCFGGYVNMGLNLNPRSADSSSEKLTIVVRLCQQTQTRPFQCGGGYDFEGQLA